MLHYTASQIILADWLGIGICHDDNDCQKYDLHGRHSSDKFEVFCTQSRDIWLGRSERSLSSMLENADVSNSFPYFIACSSNAFFLSTLRSLRSVDVHR